MSDNIMIRGITWDHPRGYQPLFAISERWRKEKGVEVKWEVRTLREFGDTPIEKLMDSYDLIVIDHPYVGSAATNKLLVPLDRHLPEAFMDLQRKESIGPGFDSYWYADHCWALPVDAAAQVAAWRKDLAEAAGWTRPDTILELRRAAASLPKDQWIGVPLCPTDIWCVFLSLSALYSDGRFFSERGIDVAVGEWTLAQILDWKSFLHPDSLDMNPIRILENMASKDEIVYTPYTFGYTNYARKGWRHKLVHFCNSPRHEQGRHCSLMGGAGIAVSVNTQHLKECLAYIQFALSAEIQKGIYFREQGQPAHLSAWLDSANDEACSGFFSSTLNTMENVYVRPRLDNFNRFQEKAADHIHTCVVKNWPVKKTVIEINELYQKLVND
jgi:multiple sugar transport system substrate-binding protein